MADTDDDESSALLVAGLTERVASLTGRLQQCVDNLQHAEAGIVGSAAGAFECQPPSALGQLAPAANSGGSGQRDGQSSRGSNGGAGQQQAANGMPFQTPLRSALDAEGTVPDSWRSSHANPLFETDLDQDDSAVGGSGKAAGRAAGAGYPQPALEAGSDSHGVEADDDGADADASDADSDTHAVAGDSVPEGLKVGAALSSLKKGLSAQVQSSLQGGGGAAGAAASGPQLKSQYKQAVDDTVQRRLLGRAEGYLSSQSGGETPPLGGAPGGSGDIGQKLMASALSLRRGLSSDTGSDAAGPAGRPNAASAPTPLPTTPRPDDGGQAAERAQTTPGSGGSRIPRPSNLSTPGAVPSSRSSSHSGIPSMPPGSTSTTPQRSSTSNIPSPSSGGPPRNARADSRDGTSTVRPATAGSAAKDAPTSNPLPRLPAGGPVPAVGFTPPRDLAPLTTTASNTQQPYPRSPPAPHGGSGPGGSGSESPVGWRFSDTQAGGVSVSFSETPEAEREEQGQAGGSLGPFASNISLQVS